MDDLNYPDLSKLVGKRVIRRDMVVFEDDENFSEVGIIVHAWIDPELDAIDCYVAFFGEVWPKLGEKPNDIPYVLKYLLSSLEESK